MKKVLKTIIPWIILVLAIVLIVFLAKYKNRSNPLSEFAQCITESGAKYYGAFWCPNCQHQNQDFKQAKKYIEYIECSTPNKERKEICTEAGITAYPTWEFGDGTRITGYQTLETLAEKTSCELPA